MCAFTCNINGGKGIEEREAKEWRRKVEGEGRICWNHAGHTRASGKNTHTIKNMLYVDTPQTITHTHTLGLL